MAIMIDSLRLITVLKSFTLKSKPKVGILLIRGGLGNQLHQLSALAYYAKQSGFIPVVYTRDSELNKRDGKVAPFESLNIGSFFSCQNKLRKANGLMRIAIKFHIALLRRYNPTFAVSESELQRGNFKFYGPIFYIKGYFQTKLYHENLKSVELLDILNGLSEGYPYQNAVDTSNRILLHLRFTDSHNPSDRHRNVFDYANILTSLEEEQISLLVDCFSDDIERARSFLAPINHRFKINFPESNFRLRSPQLLDLLSQYKIIIASNSTLLWWACFIASKRQDQEITIYSSFSEELHLDTWNIF